MKLKDIKGYAEPMPLSEYDDEEIDCTHCGTTLELTDDVVEVVSDDASLHLVCMLCARAFIPNFSEE